MKVDGNLLGASHRLLFVVLLLTVLGLLTLTNTIKNAQVLVLPLIIPRMRDIQVRPEEHKSYNAEERGGTRTRTYKWTIEHNFIAPDGVLREMITVNGKFPGPTIEGESTANLFS